MKLLKHAILVLLMVGFGVFTARAGNGSQVVTIEKALVIKETESLVELDRKLRELERKFNVSFLYKSSLVQDRFSQLEKALSGTLEERLQELLAPHQLTYQALSNDSYVLTPLPLPEKNQVAPDTLTGRVIDQKTGEPLPGVSIQIKGTIRGTTTNMDGYYTLVPQSLQDTLIFSYIGFQSRQIPIEGRTSLDIKLAETILESGDELVVVGYGTKKRSEITGSVSSINAQDIEKVPVLRVEQALQGQTAGVYVADQSGQPGETPTVRIRGAGTTGDADPLYVVDGMPVSGIDYLNPGDISSIEVLKDAASAAIYGARAANGVVLITTKSGQPGEFQASYQGYSGFQNPWKKMNQLNARQYMMMMNEGAANADLSLPFPVGADVSGATDWQEAIFNDNAMMMNHQVNISGGNEQMQYSTALSYFSQEGIIGGEKSQFDRYTVRLNLDNQVSDVFRIGNYFNVSRIERNAVLSNSEWGSPLSNALNMDPLTPIYEDDEENLQSYPDNAVRNDGRYYGISNYVTQEIVNPLARLEVTHGETQVDKLVNNLFAEYDLLPNLVLKSSLGVDLAFQRDDNFVPVYYLNSSQKNDKSLVDKTETRWFTWNFENTISYKEDFGNHNISLLGGITAQQVKFEDLFGAKANLLMTNPENAWIDVAADEESMRATGGAYNEKLLSYFGRTSYNFNDKYLLTGILRVDGSSKFGPDNRYAVFPSVSAGWILSEEKFLQDVQTINLLKLRASWGENGNQNIGNFRYTSTIATGNGYTFGDGEEFAGGAVPSSVSNPELKWETSEQLDLGIDVGLWQDRFMVKADYYIKKTKGLLIEAPIPGHVGNNAPIVNGGSVENRGFEFSVDYRNYNRDFNYNVGVNLAFNENEVTHIGNAEGVIVGAGFATYGIVSRAEEGYPIGYFWGYESDGIFQTQDEVNNYTNSNGNLLQPQAQPGDVRFKDLDGNGQIDDGDRTMIGNPTPDLTFGVNLDSYYKQFDLSIFLQGSVGNDIFNATRRHDLTTTNMSVDYLNRWTGPGTSNSLPRFTWNDANGNWTRISDLYVEDGSYLRVKNVQLGYNLSNRVANWLNLSKARIYLAADNLFTITGYSGFDPEIGAAEPLNIGIDRGIYPQARSFRLGLNVTF